MRYVLMFVENEEYAKDWEARPEDERQELFGKVEKWLADHSAQIVHRTRLQSRETATTVRLGGGDPVVTDGPFVEGKEVVSGYVEVEVADLDEALAIAKAWPSCPIVEIRPAL
ncbi:MULTISPECIES: YciI family protein [unclassified Spirillospora]|uniref:YciI family protein n=1 Tax=unclassified Spirillospora TaxID=2642701 RepID=UPI003720CB64